MEDTATANPPRVSGREVGRSARILLSELAATMRHFDYTPTPKEGELVSALRMTSAVGGIGVFLGGGFAAFKLCNFVPSLRSMRRVRAGIGAVAGLYFHLKMDQTLAIVSVQQIALLDSPMGREMVGLVQEGEFSPGAKQAMLWSLKPNMREITEPRIRPISNPFSQATVREAEQAGAQPQEAERSPGFRDDSEWAAQRSGWTQQQGKQSRNTESEWQRGASPGESWSAGDSSPSGQDASEDLLERDIFGSEDDQQPDQNDNIPRKPRYRERREERRRRHNEAETKPAVDDGMSDYFDSRWEGKGN